MRRVWKGDTVEVISGRAVGQSGQVLAVDYRKDQVVVEGANMRMMARRPGPNSPGGLVERECPIHLSNVMVTKESAEHEKELKRKGLLD